MSKPVDKPALTMAHGNWVEGGRFWGREADLEVFISRIDEGAHQLLTAQRRMGKTSLMRERRLGNCRAATIVFLWICKRRQPPPMLLLNSAWPSTPTNRYGAKYSGALATLFPPFVTMLKALILAR